MEEIDVATTADGLPVSFVRHGKTWHVAVEPVRWYERVSWWETDTRMPAGEGIRIDVMVCQVQARIGHNSRTPLVTFHLVLGRDRRTWTVRDMCTIAA